MDFNDDKMKYIHILKDQYGQNLSHQCLRVETFNGIFAY